MRRVLRAAAQALEVVDRRSGLQLAGLPTAASLALYPTHDRAAAQSAEAVRRVPRTTAKLRRRSLCRRNMIEWCVGKLKQWRGIATRYEKRAVNYQTAVVMPALITK
jgi:transposase